jgi:hypothetical protein
MLFIMFYLAVDYRTIWKPRQIAALSVQARLCRDVVLLRLFPSIRKKCGEFRPSL